MVMGGAAEARTVLESAGCDGSGAGGHDGLDGCFKDPDDPRLGFLLVYFSSEKTLDEITLLPAVSKMPWFRGLQMRQASLMFMLPR